MNTIPTWLNSLLGGNTMMIEGALLLFSGVGALLIYLDLPGSTVTLAISVILTAIYFMFLSSLERKRSLIFASAHKLISIAFSLAILATIFHLMDYPGAGLMQMMGVLFMGIAGFTYLFSYRSNLEKVIVRILLIASTGYLLWLL